MSHSHRWSHCVTPLCSGSWSATFASPKLSAFAEFRAGLRGLGQDSVVTVIREPLDGPHFFGDWLREEPPPAIFPVKWRPELVAPERLRGLLLIFSPSLSARHRVRPVRPWPRPPLWPRSSSAKEVRECECKCVRARVCMHGTFKCRPGPHTNYLESQCHTSGRHACRSVPSNPPASYPRIPQQKGRPGATKLSPTFPHTTDNSFSAAWGTTSTYNAFKIQINQAQSHSALWVLE